MQAVFWCQIAPHVGSGACGVSYIGIMQYCVYRVIADAYECK